MNFGLIFDSFYIFLLDGDLCGIVDFLGEKIFFV